MEARLSSPVIKVFRPFWPCFSFVVPIGLRLLVLDLDGVLVLAVKVVAGARVLPRDEPGLGLARPLRELDHVLLLLLGLVGVAAGSAGPEVRADQEEYNGHVEDHDDLKQRKLLEVV